MTRPLPGTPEYELALDVAAMRDLAKLIRDGADLVVPTIGCTLAYLGHSLNPTLCGCALGGAIQVLVQRKEIDPVVSMAPLKGVSISQAVKIINGKLGRGILNRAIQTNGITHDRFLRMDLYEWIVREFDARGATSEKIAGQIEAYAQQVEVDGSFQNAVLP